MDALATGAAFLLRLSCTPLNTAFPSRLRSSPFPVASQCHHLCFLRSSSSRTKSPAYIIQLLTNLPVRLNCIPISSLMSSILLLYALFFPVFLQTQFCSLTCEASVVVVALSVPLSQDHIGMPVLHTLCQCHHLKTTHVCWRYTRSVSATISRPHRHAGVTRSVSATVSRPSRHAGITHALSVPLSQDHTSMPALHMLCQCHCLKTIQACWHYTCSVSATVSRPYKHAGITHALSVPLSQDHTGMLALHMLCQCHCLKTIQACRHYTRFVCATVSRPYRHAGITHALSVPLSQDHTGMPALHMLCQCHCLKTIQACWHYTCSVSATVSRPYRHAGITHALSVPLSQDHTGMPALHTLSSLSLSTLIFFCPSHLPLPALAVWTMWTSCMYFAALNGRINGDSNKMQHEIE